MKLDKATINDFESIIKFYDDVTLRTPEMETYARWKKGQHPTEECIKAYIEEGSMYLYKMNDTIVGAMAVTMYQGEDYHAIEWAKHVEDNEASVIHILAVNPDYQGTGVGAEMIREAINLSADSGMKSIRLDALASNTPAHKIYKRIGFEYRGKQHLYAENTGWTDFLFFELKQLKINKIRQNINMEKLRKAKDFVIEHNIVEYFILCLFINYIITAYNSMLSDWYDNNIISILNQFKSNIWLFLVTAFLIIIFGLDIKKKYNRRYQFDKKLIVVLFFVTIILFENRISCDYNYVSWLSIFSYVDVITFLLCAYFVLAIVNKYRRYQKFYFNNNVGDLKSQEKIFNDSPIDDENEDIFDLKDEVIKLAERIKLLDRKKTWSLAITAPWGTGKTSFLNLIKLHVNNDDFELLLFTPRDSKSYKTIQEDFFSLLACVLSKYDSRCSHTMKDYMASLQLIDNRGLVEKFGNFYRIWNKDNLKMSIKKSFDALDKKILVLIDDFDRLSKEEILEVLKLIDSNAAFANLVFLTAYDKEQVNKTLGDSYITKDACFVDKFFNLEFSIPSRPYTYISRFMIDKFGELLITNGDEQKEIHQAITNRISLFKKYIPTLRDAKRYINQVVLDYKLIRGDVYMDEYLLVQLIKYRYYDLYKATYNKEYVEIKHSFSEGETLYLKNDLDEKISIWPILTILFPNDKETIMNSYRHIYSCQSFDNYFVNQVYSSLRIKDMKQLFSEDWDNLIGVIDKWVVNNEQSNDFIDYLNSLDMDSFDNGQLYMQYAAIIAYVACKLPNSRAYWLFMRLINLKNIEGYDKNKYKLNYNDYKNKLLDIIKKNDSNYTVSTNLHVGYKTFIYNNDENLIKDNDIWPFIKENFIQVSKDQATDNDWLLGRLRKCIDNMEESSRHLNLDTDCLKAYRARTEIAPDYYIKSFVFLGRISSSPDNNSVACEPFWRQIFEDDTQFEEFLNKCYLDKLDGAIVAWNYWQLYKSNNYQPIQYDNQGPVQEKIDNNLIDEITKLDEMKQIEKDILIIPETIMSISDAKRSEYIELLKQKKKDLKNIELYISLNGKIGNIIDNKLKRLIEIETTINKEEN